MAEARITQLTDNIWQIAVPDPFRGANVYLLVDERPVLIDAGHGNVETVAALEAALASLGYPWERLWAILYTHPHVDHMGGGAALQLRHGKGPRHLAHRQLVQRASDYSSYVQNTHGRIPEALAGYVPEAREQLLSREVLEFTGSYYLGPGPLPLEPLDPGEVLDLGQNSWQVLATPGHQRSHLAFYNAREGLLIAGDLVVGRGTSFNLLTGGEVGSYYTTLEKLMELDLHLLYPGHGAPRPAREALEEARDSTRYQEEKFLAILSKGRATRWEVAQQLFDPWPAAHMILLSLGFAVTFLLYLEGAGRVRHEIINGQSVYQLT